MTDPKKPPTPDGERIGVNLPMEGFSTLAAQFTSAMMERTRDMIMKMKSQNLPKDIICNRIRQQIRQLDDAAVELVYRRACGIPADDTFKAEEIDSVKEIKPGTAELNLKDAKAPLSLGSVVQVKGDLWTVTGVRKNGFLIKKV